MAGRLHGKICLITGIGSGIGKEAAHIFAREGAHVIGGDLLGDTAEATASDVRAAGGRIDVVRCGDLSAFEACQAIVAETLKIVDGFDVLFNNAAHCKFEFLDDMVDPAVWDHTIARELNLAFYMCLASWQPLVKRGGGSIINVGSLAAHRATHACGNVAHMAAKAGVVAMTKQLALEGGKHGIRVNSVSPGPIATPQSAHVLESDAYRKAVGPFLILGRVGKPADIANYALYLASDESDWVSGTDLLIDGAHSVL